jgi:glycosyltransferase involved in cell wall biosynthesis
VLRIGLLVRNLDEKGGISVYTHEMVRNFLSLDRENRYYLFYGSESARGAFGSHANVEEIVVPCWSKMLWDQIQVPLLANRLGLDVIFAPKMTTSFLFRGTKVLAIHGAEQFIMKRECGILDRIYVRTFLPLYAKVSDRVVVGARTSRDDLLPYLGIPASKFAITPYGAKDVFAERIPDDERAAACKKHGLDGAFVLHVGLIWGAKNFGVFPTVLDIVNRSHAIVLAHAGKPHRWKTHSSNRSISPHLRELGFVPDRELAALYQSAVALVFPSVYEGFGIPLVEAMRAGCPVVSTNWGAMKEICGNAALLVDVHQSEEIANAIVRILEEPGLREDLIRRGRARAARATWNETARLTIDVFDEVTRGKIAMAREKSHVLP